MRLFYFFIFSFIGAVGIAGEATAELNKMDAQMGYVQLQNPQNGTIVIAGKTFRLDNEVVIHPAVKIEANASAPQIIGRDWHALTGKQIQFKIDAGDMKPPRISEIWFLTQ